MKIITTVLTVLFFSMNTFAQKENYKVFPFKNGVIEYKQEGNAKGTHTKYIEGYGYKQADFTETETTVFGFTNKEKSGTILIGPKVYALNYKTKTASVGNNPVYESYAKSNGSDYDKLGRDAMASLGFSNTTKTEKIAGKKCEIWKGSLGRIWVWKGLALKSETTVLGISIIETAVNIKINTSVNSKVFEVPKEFEVEDVQLPDSADGMEGMYSNEGMELSKEDKDKMQKVSNMSYPEFRKMVKKDDPNASEDEIQQIYQMMKQMAKSIK